MGSHFGWNSFLDHSRVFYYEKAPRDEDETHQPSSAEDISTGLIEDLAYIISGNENGHVWPCASGIRVKDGKFFTIDRELVPLTRLPRWQ